MDLQTFFLQETQNESFKQEAKKGQSVLYLGLQGASRAYMAKTLLSLANEQKVVIITNNLLQADHFYNDLQNDFDEDQLHLFNVPESVAADWAIASPEALADRLTVLNWARDPETTGVLITPMFGLKRLLTPTEIWDNTRIQVKLGDELEPAKLVQRLLNQGYQRAEIVMTPGEMSQRGDIVDFYPLNAAYPVRISLGFDEVERISTFDPNTQKSLHDQTSIQIQPSQEFIVLPEQLQAQADAFKQQMFKSLTKIKDELVRDLATAVVNDEVSAWKNGEMTENSKYFHRYMYPETTTLLDYIGDQAFLILDDYARLIQEEANWANNTEMYLQTMVERGQLPAQVQVYDDFKKSIQNFKGRKFYFSLWQQGLGSLKFDGLYQYQTRMITQFYDQMDALKIELTAWIRTGRTVVIMLKDKERVKEVQAILQEIDVAAEATDEGNIFANKVNLIAGGLSGSIEFVQERLVLLAEADIFHTQKKRRKAKKPLFSNAERIKNYQQLEVGDYVVHVNHGIGRYTGIETIEFAGTHQDYLTIVFADQAAIHVPIDQIDLVQKYVSAEGKEPKLNKMGGSEWAKTKQKVSSKIEDIADELIDLYASREAQKGLAFGPDTPEQLAFENAFPYSETDDQIQSIAEIKKDMEAEKPMDRLLVGDVGFGKTEVAMRAVFKALMEGKQVAFLVPTTVLAQQHYETFVERFADWPFEIGLLSRFRSKAQQNETIAGLKKGQIDIVIGTHRVLSKDVEFLDLGLLVVDEEQRFGVKAKEKLKALKANVDVLTLTATPIPRTLNMSMLGVRDLSVIETPPANRYPVQTFVMEQNYGAVKDAIEREIARDGQVFYLFNNVAQIEEKAALINELVPEARVAIAHGQMTVVQLENVMMDFVLGEFDVLVTTTIIETGVDIPNANTLLVEGADRMGLSTLYQLRGRVGRSTRIAYAYFMYRPDKMLSEVSEKRLMALRDFTELGSGFKIAMRDLSIRGAGNLLGKQQHGFVNSVGFDLYSQMLREAVQRKRGILPAKQTAPVEISLSIDAYIPQSYIHDERQKVEIYKRVNAMTSVDEMWDLDDELMDRYGEPPVETQLLLQVGTIKSAADKIGVTSIKRITKSNTIEVLFHDDLDQKVMTPAIFKALEDNPFRLAMKQVGSALLVSLGLNKLSTEEWLDYLLQFMTQLADNENIVQMKADQLAKEKAEYEKAQALKAAQEEMANKAAVDAKVKAAENDANATKLSDEPGQVGD